MQAELQRAAAALREAQDAQFVAQQRAQQAAGVIKELQSAKVTCSDPTRLVPGTNHIL